MRRNTLSEIGDVSYEDLGKEQTKIRKLKDEFLSAREILQVKIMASLVPDEIIYGPEFGVREYQAAVMLGDVSGFTNLCEQYNKRGRGGPSRLTEVLNMYIGSMVQQIMLHNGDLLKFSGDAFFAFWKSDKGKQLESCVCHALDCAIIIQKHYGRYETDVGVILRVKLAIAVGDVYFSVIGANKRQHYVLVGDPVLEMKEAEHMCGPSEIVVTPSLWKYVNTAEYLHEFIEDGQFIKVYGAGPGWKKVETFEIEHFTMQQEETSKENSSPLRPSVRHASKNEMKEILRPHIIPPVMRGIDFGQPVEYLTEMRNVEILFINLIPVVMKNYDILINITDLTFQIVCTIVNSMSGCVNKVSLFDKDLMFLCIFGLRGYKVEQESQVALLCAAEIYATLSKIEQISSVSVGVTSGTVYCGIVGHDLRREYTVIGPAVNRGARLMCNYTDKVTCDREIFLYSYLDPSCFILQEPKALKGLENVGPIYEYRGEHLFETSITEIIPDLSKYPLLGRGEEIKLFDDMLQNMKYESASKNVLIFKGDSRQGKSRLLNEILFTLKPNIRRQKIHLSDANSDVPYFLLQMIFGKALQFSKRSTPSDRQKKIREKLGTRKHLRYLGALNKVFNVNFKITKSFLNLDEDEQDVKRLDIITSLYKECFPQLTVIGIDNIENIDEESADLLPSFFQSKHVLFVITVGKTKDEIEGLINSKYAHFIELTGISLWYLNAIACQMLCVSGLPMILGRQIQLYSQGNPGWIESYLSSLIQGGFLIVRDIPLKMAKQFDLEIPQAELMVRGSARKGSSISSQKKIFYGDDDGFQMFQFVDEATDIVDTSNTKYSDVLKAALLTQEYQIEKLVIEGTVEGMLIKTFDDLARDQQLLVKCAAVIGDKFRRDLLIHLMENPPDRQISVAIKHLFEIRVLDCAGLDFVGNTTSLTIHHRMVPPLEVGVPFCRCENLEIADNCLDLPKYASCSCMKFHNPLMATLVYKLLPENHQMALHGQIAKYLERTASKCQACGGGRFGNMLNEHLHGNDLSNYKLGEEEYFLVQSHHEADDPNQSKSRLYLVESSVFADRPKIPLLKKGVYETKYEKHKQKSLPPTHQGALRMSTEFLIPDLHYVPDEVIFERDIDQKPVSTSTTSFFWKLDFTHCKCSLILNGLFTELLYHWKNAGNSRRVFDISLEYVNHCMKNSNYSLALMKLEEAVEILQPRIHNATSLVYPWKLPYVIGKLLTMEGSIYLEIGERENARRTLYQAMAEFKFPFPHEAKVVTQAQLYLMKIAVSLKYWPRWLTGTLDGYDAACADAMSKCLVVLASLFQNLDKWKHAFLAATWALHEALLSNFDFAVLCNAYSKLLEIFHYYGKENLALVLEKHSLKLCKSRSSNLNSKELQAIAILYEKIFISRIHRGELSKAATLGHKILRISATLHDMSLQLLVLPPLIFICVLQYNLPEAAALLNELEFKSKTYHDDTSQSWYYGLSLNFQIQTCYHIQPFDICERFCLEMWKDHCFMKHNPAWKFCFSSLWLWNQRNCDWGVSTLWDTDEPYTWELRSHDSWGNVFTGLQKFQAMIISVVTELNQLNLEIPQNPFKKVKQLMRKLEKATRNVKSALPRFLHLKSYYLQVLGKRKKSMRLLEQATAIAYDQGNHLEVLWALHSKNVWTGRMDVSKQKYWQELTEKFINGTWAFDDTLGKQRPLYSLPLPVKPLR